MKLTTVLVVDDEPRYRELMRLNLTRRGYRVLEAPDGLGALNVVEAEAPDLVILDLMLPDIDGYEVCRRIRAYSTVPIIMLTARAEQAEKVRGLQLGADDYVTKPFGADELLARVEAVLRRAAAGNDGAAGTIVADAVRIDLAQHRVTVHGREIDLTPTEYRVLEQLARNAGRVLIADELLRRVWGPEYAGASDILQTAIHRLRLKIEDDPAAPRYVLTKRGVGYLFAAS